MTISLAVCHLASMPWHRRILEEVSTEMCSSIMVPSHHNSPGAWNCAPSWAGAYTKLYQFFTSDLEEENGKSFLTLPFREFIIWSIYINGSRDGYNFGMPPEVNKGVALRIASAQKSQVNLNLCLFVRIISLATCFLYGVIQQIYRQKQCH